jgi:hypothetical protein
LGDRGQSMGPCIGATSAGCGKGEGGGRRLPMEGQRMSLAGFQALLAHVGAFKVCGTCGRLGGGIRQKGTCAQGEKVQADLPLLPLLNEIAHKSVCLVKVVCGPLQISLLQISLSTCLAI